MYAMLRLVALVPSFLALRGAAASGGSGEGAPDPRRLSSASGPTVTNLALGRPTTQGPRTLYGAVASRAVDGNTDGGFFNGSVTHTGGDPGVRSHWTVTLDEPATIERVKVWNRTDRTGCEFSIPDGDCRKRLIGATLSLLDGAGNVVVERQFGEAVDFMEVDFTDGQYQASKVRVRLPPQSDNMALSLAEVEVLGFVPTPAPPPPVCYADAAASYTGHCVSNTGRLASGGYRQAGRAPTFDECAAFCAPPRGGGASLLGLAHGTAGSNACHCYFDVPTADPGFEVSFPGDPGNAGRIEGGNGVAAQCRPRVECAAPTPAPPPPVTSAPTVSLDPTCNYYPRYPQGRCVCEIRCPAGQRRYGDGSACTGGGFPNCDLGICHNNPNSLPTCSTAQEYLAPPVTPPPVTPAPVTPAPVTPAPVAAPTSPTPKTIENAGKGCWGHCDEKGGDCAYCGSGQCCRAVDFRNQVPGCELAENAVGARCGNYKGNGFPSLMNVGLPCIGACGKQAGDCDYCGAAGQCCRPFDGERCVPGCELASEDSWMMPGSQCGQFKDPSAAPAHCTTPGPTAKPTS